MKVTKLSESDSSSSTDDEEARTTPGAELSFGVLSSDQNKIRRKIMQKKLVRKGHRPLEIREPHNTGVMNT